MPRSQTPLHSALVALVAVLGVGGCQTQSRSNGIETGSLGDRSYSDTGVV